MAYSITEYNTDGIQTTFSCIFPVIESNDITVNLDGVKLTENVDYNVLNFISFGDVCSIEFLYPVAENLTLTIQRNTDINSLKTEFTNGSVLFLDDDLNKVNLQLLYALQEADDRINNYVNRISGNNVMLQNLDMNLNKIVNLSDGVESSDAVNLGQVISLFNALDNVNGENPFSGTGYQIGQTAISSVDLASTVSGFTFVDRTVDNYVDAVVYSELASVTSYDNIGGFIYLPSILPFDTYNKYYTRIL